MPTDSDARKRQYTVSVHLFINVCTDHVISQAQYFSLLALGHERLYSTRKDIPNRYKVGTLGARAFFVLSEVWKLPNFIEFRSSGRRLKLPFAAYLRLHAASCQEAHVRRGEKMDGDEYELSNSM